MPTADLEISIHRWDRDSYAVEMRFRDPNNDADLNPERAEVQFDFTELGALALGNAVVDYGRLLTDRLFSNPNIREMFSTVRALAHGRGYPLRLRLWVAPSAPELHSLWWETLRDPQMGTWLLSSENILFSRYLSSQDFRPVQLRPKSELRALVVIANPHGLGSSEPGGYPNLAPLDVEGECKRVADALGAIQYSTLLPGNRATLNNIINRLHEEHDILYLACHGALVRGIPRLWLEDDNGNASVVAGTDLVTRLSDLSRPPRLVVLASCQSAGDGGEAYTSDAGGALASLGPRLAQAGIPAVLAMQGKVAVSTVSAFMSVFFRELQRDGQIDLATAAGRGAVSTSDDSWMPVLFMRLASGRIWYVPGFMEEQESYPRWPALLSSIREGRCTPILGPGLLEPITGSTRDIARRWAETHHYPMAAHYREDLPQVAQYLSVTQSDPFMRTLLRKELTQEIIRRFGKDLPDYTAKASPEELGEKLEELISKAGATLRDRNPAEPHRVLAALPFPLYVTTNPDSLLVDALRNTRIGPQSEVMKNPRVELCRWTYDVDWPPSIYDEEPNYQPDKEQPLVYYLFGELRVTSSVVVAEDNYFDYLYGMTRKDNPMPSVVRRALADTALLFLGFHLDDWNFRVLFRSIMGQEGRSRRRRYVHVAVQIDPEEGRLLDPQRARHFLEDRFEGADISIYWGSVDDFLKELREKWNAEYPLSPIN
jgi:hypothetical protein